MTGLQRTLAFLAGQPVDRLPLHPIVMRWAAKHAGVKYRDFCLEPAAKCQAMIRCADDFHFDWVTVMSDPYAEASAFGLQVEYPEDSLPVDVGGHLPDLEAVKALLPYSVPGGHPRLAGRLAELREFRQRVGDRLFIVGWVEGPVAEYADIRGVSNAAMDMLDDPPTVAAAMDIITDCAIEFITAQIEAGAHCIGIGDAFCSQIGPDLYRRFAFERERRMIEHIHRLGAIAKLHICGNTTPILPDMIATGADIIDVDHLVPDMARFAPLLGPGQVFSGHADPVSVVQNAPPDQVLAAATASVRQAAGRCIISAGCEITPDTPAANIHALLQATPLQMGSVLAS